MTTILQSVPEPMGDPVVQDELGDLSGHATTIVAPDITTGLSTTALTNQLSWPRWGGTDSPPDSAKTIKSAMASLHAPVPVGKLHQQVSVDSLNYAARASGSMVL